MQGVGGQETGVGGNPFLASGICTGASWQVSSGSRSLGSIVCRIGAIRHEPPSARCAVEPRTWRRLQAQLLWTSTRLSCEASQGPRLAATRPAEAERAHGLVGSMKEATAKPADSTRKPDTKRELAKFYHIARPKAFFAWCRQSLGYRWWGDSNPLSKHLSRIMTAHTRSQPYKRSTSCWNQCRCSRTSWLYCIVQVAAHEPNQEAIVPWTLPRQAPVTTDDNDHITTDSLTVQWLGLAALKPVRDLDVFAWSAVARPTCPAPVDINALKRDF